MNAEQILGIIKGFREEIPWQYLVVAAMAIAVFSALNCFLGYRLRKVWSCILGIGFGGGGGTAAVYLVLHDKTLAILGGAVCALLFGALAWVLYKFGVFVMCGGLVYACILFLLSEPSLEQCLIALAAWVFAGTLALGYEKQVVVAITAFCGAYGTIHMVFFMTKIETRAGELILTLVLGLIGAVVQAAPFFKGEDVEAGLLNLFSRKKKKKVVHKSKVTHVHKVKNQEKNSRYVKRPSSSSREEEPAPRYDRREPQRIYSDREAERETYGTYEREHNARYSQGNPYDSYGYGTVRGDESRGYKEDLDSTRVYDTRYQESREDLDKTRVYTGQEIPFQPETRQKNPSYMAPGMGIDLDNLNRELSQEIQKIYQEENQE